VTLILISDVGLKSVGGTLRYDFPASEFDPSFDTALIWCQQLSQLFGAANLTAP